MWVSSRSPQAASGKQEKEDSLLWANTVFYIYSVSVWVVHMTTDSPEVTSFNVSEYNKHQAVGMSNLHRLHQRGQRCTCWGRWIPERSSCPLWQKTWPPWRAGMIIPDKNHCPHVIYISQPQPTTSLLDRPVLRGYLKKAVGMGEVTVGMTALEELLQQSRDAMPLGPFISLLEQTSWELRHTYRSNLK